MESYKNSQIWRDTMFLYNMQELKQTWLTYLFHLQM